MAWHPPVKDVTPRLDLPARRPSAPRFPPLRCSAGLLDFYVFSPLSRLLGPKFTERDFTLRDRLGGGNYGQGACVLCMRSGVVGGGGA